MRGFDPEKMKQARANALANQPRLGFRPRGSEQERSQPGPGLGFGPTSKLEAQRAQAQNQAPDSIPAMVKPGEFVLPPDTVHAMGGASALQAAVDATHTPSAAAPKVPRGFKPEVFFDAGGDVEEQRRRQSLNSPGGTFPGSRLQGDSGSSGMPSTQAARIAAQPTVAPAPAADKVGGFGYQQNNQEVGQSIKDSWNQGNYGEAVGKTVAGTVGMVTTPIIDLAARGSSAAWDGAKGFGRGLVGADDGSQAPNSTPPAVKASAPAVTPGAGATAAARATAPSNNFAAVNEYSQAPSTGSAPTSGQASQIAPGIFRSGNSYGDSAQAAALNNEPRGLPSRQNDLAAQNLAAQSTARGFTPGQRTEVEQPRLGFPGFRTPTIAHSGNDWQARNDLRNAAVSASSIKNTLEWGGPGAENNPAMQEYRARLSADQALRQAQPGLEAEAMRQNGNLAREGIQQAGGLQREAMQQAGETGRTGMRVGIEQQRLQGEAEARGFKTRAQRQEEQLRNTFLDPDATPQQKLQAQQSLATLQGKDKAPRWKTSVVQGGMDAAGNKLPGYGLLTDEATGEYRVIAPGQGAADPKAGHLSDPASRPIGTTSTVNGKTAVWDGGKWVPRA